MHTYVYIYILEIQLSTKRSQLCVCLSGIKF